MTANCASESHKLDLEDFEVEAIVDSDGECEVVFSRGGKPVFRAMVSALNTALTFVERHAEVMVVSR